MCTIVLPSQSCCKSYDTIDNSKIYKSTQKKKTNQWHVYNILLRQDSRKCTYRFIDL